MIVRVARGMSTLSVFRYQRHFRARRGAHGEGSNRHGRNAAILDVSVPQGTAVLDETGEQLLADLVEPDDTWVAVQGGHGGKGNARFATSTRQAPRFAEDGKPGESRWVRLELRVLADVGLVGFPNAGKSSLISRISSARPRVADYPFTTVTPVLGVVEATEDTSFVVADIPGLIEGAHRGQGLGIRFLRHLERTRVLVHLVDLSPDSGRDPAVDLDVIDGELRAYSPKLAERPRLVALNKMDLQPAREVLDRLHARCRAEHRRCLEISAATGQGLKALVREMAGALAAVEAHREPAGEGGA